VQVVGLFRTSVYQYVSPVYAGYTLTRPAALAATVNSYEMVGNISTTTVTDSVTGKTYPIGGDALFGSSSTACPSSQLIKLTVSRAHPSACPCLAGHQQQMGGCLAGCGQVEAGNDVFDGTVTAITISILTDKGANAEEDLFPEGFE
jgi:hypothetical protein